MALADLNPRSTSKYLISQDFTGGEGRLLTIDTAATIAAGVTVLKPASAAGELPVAVIVVGAASDTGIYPGYATSCEVYDTLIGCFDGALCGQGGGITAGDAVGVDGTGAFQTVVPANGTFVVGYALTSASEGDQFTIKFALTTR